MARPCRRAPAAAAVEGSFHSTVTDLARLRGWSTSRPRVAAISQASTCSGTVVTSGASSVGVRGTRIRWSAYGHDGLVAVLGDDDGAGPAGPDLLDVGDDLAVHRLAAARRRHDDDDRRPLVDQGDRTVLELAGGEALGVHVGQLLELERPLERHREAHVPAEEQHRACVGQRRGPARAPAPCRRAPRRPPRAARRRSATIAAISSLVLHARAPGRGRARPGSRRPAG